MILHLIQEDMSSQEMAQLAKGRLRNKIEQLEQSLEGYLSDHHRLILQLSLQMVAPTMRPSKNSMLRSVTEWSLIKRSPKNWKPSQE